MMMMEEKRVKAMGLVAAVAMMVGSAGCVFVVGDDEFVNDARNDAFEQQKYNRVAVPKIALGTTIDAVRDDLGEPHFAEAFSGDDGEYRVLFYRTSMEAIRRRWTRRESRPCGRACTRGSRSSARAPCS